MSTNRAFICNKISSIYLYRFVDIYELRCLRIGANVVSIRGHRRIGLSTNRDQCGVDSSTSTNRDVYQCGYLRIDLLPSHRCVCTKMNSLQNTHNNSWYTWLYCKQTEYSAVYMALFLTDNKISKITKFAAAPWVQATAVCRLSHQQVQLFMCNLGCFIGICPEQFNQTI